MIIKDYFTDGLLQIAIVLSLLRSDLDSFLDTSVRPLAVWNHLLETNDGPLSGITRTDLNFHYSEFAREYPKVVDSNTDRFPSVLRDLHSLSYYRRFDGISTNVHAWLVNDGGLDGATSGGERGTENNADDHENAVSENVSSSPSVDSTSGVTSEPDNLNLFVDDELSKEVDCVLFCFISLPGLAHLSTNLISTSDLACSFPCLVWLVLLTLHQLTSWLSIIIFQNQLIDI